MKDFYEHIDAYCNGRLSEEEMKEMDSAMANDNDLRMAVENHDVVEKILDANIEDQLRAQVEAVQSKLDSSEQGDDVLVKSKPKRFRLLFIILGLIFAVLAVLLLTLNKSEKVDDVQYATLLDSYEFPENRGTRSAELITTKLDSAIYYFDLRRFEDSEQLMDDILRTSPENRDAIFYKAHLLFHSKDLVKTKQWIEKYGLQNTELGKLVD